MKKLILIVIAIITVTFTACKKENVQPTHKVTTLADSPSQGGGDLGDDGDKGDLGQGDGGLGTPGH